MKTVKNHRSLLLTGMLDMNPGAWPQVKEKAACGFLSPHNLQVLSRAIQNGVVGVLTLEVTHFYAVAASAGEDGAYMVLDTILDETRRDFPVFYMGSDLLALEKTGLSGFAMFFSLPGKNQFQFFNAYASLRFKVQEMVNKRLAGMGLPPVSLLIGATFIEPDLEGDLDRTLFRAFCEAQRMSTITPESDRFNMHREFLDILEQAAVTSLYQPVVDFQSGTAMGWEAFSRGPEGGSFRDPMVMFGFAREIGSVPELERLCLRKAVAGYGEVQEEHKLFLNIHPLSLRDPGCIFEVIAGFIQGTGLRPEQLVIEFTERQPENDPNLILARVKACRDHGFLVAVDDVGAGDSSLRLLSQIRPDFIKADVSLTGGIDSNPIKRIMVETLVLLAEKVGGRVIAEGLESDTEFSSLVSMGVQAGQGYLFSRPAAPKPDVRIEVPARLSLREMGGKDLKCSTPVRAITQPALDIEVDTTIRDVQAVLGDRPPMSSIVVTSGDAPVGLLMNYNLNRHLGTKYGVSLYYHRTVDLLMDAEPLIVSGAMPIEDVARAAMNRRDEKIYDDIIVIADGELLGTVSVQRMLDTMSQLQVELAKGSNPLTGLPGNVAIEQEIERRSRQKIPSSIAYVDLDNFKVYNDVYGFNNGDHIIGLIADCLKMAVVEKGRPEDFVGHIGGDDFLVLAGPDHCEDICRDVLDAFAEGILDYYTEEDRKRGHIESKGRDGKMASFPLCSASIGILDLAFDHPFTLEELGHRAAEVKKFAKSKPGNSLVRDRRAPLGSTEAKEQAKAAPATCK